MKKIEKINEIIHRTLHTDGNSSPRIADNAFAEYEYYLFEDAIEFYKLNKIYFDEETLQNIVVAITFNQLTMERESFVID